LPATKLIMKKAYLLLLFVLNASCILKAQTAAGSAEKKLTDSICNCINQTNISEIKTPEAANAAITDCFTKYTSILMEIAEERKVDFDNSIAMSLIGSDIGKNLIKQNCSNFIKLSMQSSKASKNTGDNNSGSTRGVLKRIENKGFNYVVIADAAKNEKSFLWLRQFAGSEKFTGVPASYAGKKVNIQWQEIEVYLPAAKGYYKVKEIVGVELL
jgi:hypothetical protein